MPHVGLPVMKPVNRSCSSAAQPITAGIPSTDFFFFFFFQILLGGRMWTDLTELCVKRVLSHSHIIFTLPFFFFFFLLLQQRTLGNKEVTLPYCWRWHVICFGVGGSKLVMLISVMENLFNWKSSWWRGGEKKNRKEMRPKENRKKGTLLCLVNHSKDFSTCWIWKRSLISQLLGDVFSERGCVQECK